MVSATAGRFWCDPRLDRLIRRAGAWLPLVNIRELGLVSARLRNYR